LLFANSAKEELVNKPIFKGEQLFDVLTQTTLNKAKRTGLPIFHFTENEQVGATFGERFTNAIAAVFDRGFDNIITIGNDTPHLKTQHLKKAAEQLALGKSVLGPSVDGGFYLLGLQKNNFDIDVLKNLPWHHLNLFNRISKWLQLASIETIKLPVLQDLDSEKDLKSILNFSKSLSSSILLLILSILDYFAVLNKQLTTFVDLFNNKSMYNKGSPRIYLPK